MNKRLLVIFALLLFTQVAQGSPELSEISKRRVSVQLQGEMSPWLATRTGGGIGVGFGTRSLSPDLRLRYVNGLYNALFATLGDSQAASNTSAEYATHRIANGRMDGVLIEPGLRVRGALLRESSRWEQSARVGFIYGNLHDRLFDKDVKVLALSAEFGMPYKGSANGNWYLVPYLGYEFGFAHREPAQPGEMSQSRKLYYLSYRGGIGIEWLF